MGRAGLGGDGRGAAGPIGPPQRGEQAVVLTTLAGCSVTQALGPAVVAGWMAAVLQVDGATLLPYSLGVSV